MNHTPPHNDPEDEAMKTDPERIRTEELLLAEFRAFRDNEWREFRDDVATWKVDSGERLATLETHVKTGITGNGTPSRLASVEKKIEELASKVWWIFGVGSGISALVAVVVAIISHHK